MIALNVMRRGFALYQLVLWNDRGITGPFVRAVHRDIPLRQTLDHLLQGRFVPAATCPVQELPSITIQSLPDPKFPAFFLELMPHLIQL
jgi:hypothetical protein